MTLDQIRTDRDVKAQDVYPESYSYFAANFKKSNFMQTGCAARLFSTHLPLLRCLPLRNNPAELHTPLATIIPRSYAQTAGNSY